MGHSDRIQCGECLVCLSKVQKLLKVSGDREISGVRLNFKRPLHLVLVKLTLSS